MGQIIPLSVTNTRAPAVLKKRFSVYPLEILKPTNLVHMLSWLSLDGVNAKSNQLETFEHFKARLSLHPPPPPPQSSVRQNESLSQVGRRAGSTLGSENRDRF